MPESNNNQVSPQTIDWQGHRGARAALPENTIPAFLFALQHPYIKTLELDVCVSADSQVVVSHEPYFNHLFSSHPDDKPITKEEEKSLNLYAMTFEEIKKYDVGKRGNSKFPEQKPMAITKPSLIEMITATEDYCQKSKRKAVYYNIEIKSHPKGYGIYFPEPAEYVSLVLATLSKFNLSDRVNLQSFDVNILEEIHKQAPKMSNALLVYEPKSFKDHLATISFKPTNFSPDHKLLTESMVAQAHAEGIKVVPWTVNKLKDMQRMVDLGVDGIITDYVDRPAALLR